MSEFDENLRLSSRLVQELYHKYAFNMYDDMPYGYAIMKVIEADDDNGEAFFIYANSEFLSMTDNEDIDIKGKSYREVMGGLSISVYRNLCKAAYHKEKSIFFENINSGGSWLDVMTFPSIQNGYCAMALFDSFVFDSNFIENEDFAEADRVIVKIAKMIHSSEDDFDINVHRALRFLGDCLKCEKTYILEFFHGQPLIRYEWQKDENFDEEEYAPEVIMERIQYIEPWIRENHIFIVENIDNVADKNEPVYKVMRTKGIRSMIMVPYYVDNSIVGYLIIDNYKEKNICTIKYLVEITAITFFSEIHSRRLVEKLTFMGIHDQLTNVNNRNAFNLRVCELEGIEDCVGIAYADVNGLKMINDELGHDAGDARIIKIASMLSRVFLRRDVFRIGGDEFVVIVPGIGKDEFDEKIAHLKKIARQLENEEKIAANSGVNMFFSLGYVWADNCFEINDLLKKADEVMYEEKQKYYKVVGHRR